MNRNQYRASSNVVVAGSTSQAGRAVVEELSAAGYGVAAVDLDESRVQDLARAHERVAGYACDLSNASAVDDLARRIRTEIGPVDGLIHLVGGWRGGEGLTGQTDSDWDFLHRGILTTLRNTSRTFYTDLEESPSGRLAIVSATAAANPTANGAAYSAIKSAAETWTLAIADGFRRNQAGNAESSGQQRSAAVVLVVKALLDDQMRSANPQRAFPGYTHVKDLAAKTAELFTLPADELNGKRIPLS